MENPTSDEKVLAALAHASVLLSFFGPVGPALIWVFQRKKSKYVRFHALQAMGYQSFSFWAWMIGLFVMVGVMMLVVILGTALETARSDMPAFPFLIQPIFFMGIFGLWGIFFLVGIIGAVFCMMNREFRYPIIGHWLKKKLLDGQVSDADYEEWEDSWVSGVCHSTAILQLWGIITPLIVWFLQKERSAKIRFQALQALIYQLVAFVVYMIGVAAYMLVFFLSFAGMAVFGLVTPSLSNHGQPPPVLGIIMLIFFGVMAIFWLLIMIAAPIYYLLAAVASIFTIRGKDFKYPILGGIIAKRMKASKEEVVSAS